MDIIRFKKTDQEFSSVSFVASVIAPKDARPYKKYVRIAGNEMMGTDGSRLHIAAGFEEFRDGYYEVLSLKKSEIILTYAPETDQDYEYPDINPVFEMGPDYKEISFEAKPLKAFTKAVRTIPNELTFQYRYFEAISTGDEFFTVNVDTADRGAAIFLNQTKRAAIMPVKDWYKKD